MLPGQPHLLDAGSKAGPTDNTMHVDFLTVPLKWWEKATLLWAVVATGLGRPVLLLNQAQDLD